jgi:ubiquinone/menaquinone biosynthesis C-methylase UbiE
MLGGGTETSGREDAVIEVENLMADPERYEQWFTSRFGKRADRIEHRILEQLLSGLGEVRSLLDVGCGSGHFAALWAAGGLTAVGLDRDAAMLAFARRHRPGLPVMRGDALALPVPDRCVDVVAMITVLEFLDDPEQGLREAARVARRALLLGVLNSASPIAWARRLRRARAYRQARFYSPWSLRHLVRSAIGDRKMAVHSATGLYPLPWLDGLRALPCGAFIGMRVCFIEEESDGTRGPG